MFSRSHSFQPARHREGSPLPHCRSSSRLFAREQSVYRKGDRLGVRFCVNVIQMRGMGAILHSREMGGWLGRRVLYTSDMNRLLGNPVLHLNHMNPSLVTPLFRPRGMAPPLRSPILRTARARPLFAFSMDRS